MSADSRSPDAATHPLSQAILHALAESELIAAQAKDAARYLASLENVANAAYPVIAAKEGEPKSGIDFWAEQPETEYTEAIPGIGRTIRLACAFKDLLATGWRYGV